MTGKTQRARPIDEREWTATERGYHLALLLFQYPNGRHGNGWTTEEIVEELGYGGYSGAASMLERSRLTGLWRDDDKKWRLMLDGWW